MSKSSKAVGKDGTPKNQHTLTRTHTPGSFRVKQTWPVPPSLPLARRTQSDPLPASRKTHHSDCASTVPTSSCNKFSRTSPRASTADPAVRPPQILRCAERQTRVKRAVVQPTDRSKSLSATLRAVPSKSSNLNRADGKDGTVAGHTKEPSCINEEPHFKVLPSQTDLACASESPVGSSNFV